MKPLMILAILCLLCSLPVMGKAQYGPIISNYGPVHLVKERDVELPKDLKYKVVFDVYVTASEWDVHSRRLESVARFINMHAMSGVPMENMDIAVVFHGKATKDILSNKAYKAKYQVDNPNRELIEILAENGVELHVCGQTTDYLEYKREEILPEIKIALSAMTQLAVYQAKGYALLP